MTFTPPPDTDVIGCSVRHATRLDLRKGRVTAVYAGVPPVCRVEWGETATGVTTTWGFYRCTDLVREETA